MATMLECAVATLKCAALATAGAGSVIDGPEPEPGFKLGPAFVSAPVRVSKRRRDLALADWRHAWDNAETTEEKEHYWRRAIEAQGALEAHEILQEYIQKNGALGLHPGAFEKMREIRTYSLRNANALRYA